MAGADIPTIQKISGHKTVGMVMHYVHVFGQHIDNAISVLNQGFSDTVTRKLHTTPRQAVSAPSPPVSEDRLRSVS